MTFLKRCLFLTIAIGGVTVTAACSDDEPKDSASEKQGVEAACEHLNSVCASTQGYKKQNCTGSNAEYAKLPAADKAKADSIVPCVMASNSCQPALQCLTTDDATTPGARGDETSPQTTDAEGACEHINDVCKGQSGFKTQDCSGSNAAYARLTPADKATADAIAPCIMKSTSCENAFACLQQARK